MRTWGRGQRKPWTNQVGIVGVLRCWYVLHWAVATSQFYGVGGEGRVERSRWEVVVYGNRLLFCQSSASGPHMIEGEDEGQVHSDTVDARECSRGEGVGRRWTL
jgi:hypothetical protein